MQALGPDEIAMFFKAHEHCMEQGKVDDDIIGRVLQGELVDDQPFDCYVACMLEKIGLVIYFYYLLFNFIFRSNTSELFKLIFFFFQSNSDGSLNEEQAISKIPADIEIHDELEKAIRTCSSRSKIIYCKKLFLYLSFLYFFVRGR